jgi:peptidoglycan LD-endopeptidase LytH
MALSMRLGLLFWIGCVAALRAEVFILPTPNRAILEGGLGEKYLVGTIGKPWPSGGFGCVRSEGFKMHEGLDIRCTKRDRKGEPIDPIFASAAGTVAYINTTAGLSNYGRYIVLRHTIDGLEICTLYAHLSDIADGLAVGQVVKQGQTIATMGRSTNTREGISKERAHLHFEINFALNDRYAQWHGKYMEGQRNDHGAWNGHNLAAVDPGMILLAQARDGAAFSLQKTLRERKELFRVLVRDPSFGFLKKNPALIKRNPLAEKEGAAAYEISLDFNGAPIELIPKAPSEVRAGPKIQLLNVNEAEKNRCRCSKMVVARKGHWELSNTGELRIGLLIY